jgi:hypothetical protein
MDPWVIENLKWWQGYVIIVLLVLGPNHFVSHSQVPSLGRRSKKRKRTQTPDSNCSDDDAVSEILIQRPARNKQ